jgi:hypothetical protein
VLTPLAALSCPVGSPLAVVHMRAGR